MAYFSQNNDEHYKAYYKPKQAPGGTSSISFGDDVPVSTHKKQGANPDCPKTAAQLEKENSRPNSERSGAGEAQDSGCRKTAAQIERESREAKDESVTESFEIHELFGLEGGEFQPIISSATHKSGLIS